MLSFLSLSFLFSCLSFFFETKSHYVAQAGLELAIQFSLKLPTLLSQPLKYWRYRPGLLG